MARGWESKSVADQIENADERPADGAGGGETVPQIERRRRERLQSLKLSQSRTLQQLEVATRPAHRELLQRTLAALQIEIDQLE